MDNSKNLVDKVKSGARTLAVSAVIGLATFAYSPKAEATIINSFKDFNSSAHVRSVGMSSGTNLLLRDLLTFEDSIVEGYNQWHMGFINYVESNAVVVGYADNKSNLYPGKMYGEYFDEILNEGAFPEDVWIVHDGLGDGLGYIEGGNWHMGDDDVLYDSQDILFGLEQIRGDVGQLPMLVTSGSMYLPQMIIVPEPSTIALLGLGALALGRKRKYVESKVVD